MTAMRKYQTQPFVDDLLKIHEGFSGGIFSGSDPALREVREAALCDLQTRGLPSRADESYRFARYQPHLQQERMMRFKQTPADTPPNDLTPCDVPSLQAHTIYFVNGFYYTPGGEALTMLPSGVVFGSLRQALQELPDRVWPYLRQLPETPPDAFVSLSTLFTVDGLFIYIPRGVVLEKPIQVISLVQGTDDRMVHARHLFVAEENAQAKIALYDYSLTKAHVFSNSTLQCLLAESAHLELAMLQDQHNNALRFLHLFGDLQAHATMKTSIITLHGGFIRNNAYMRLLGERAECTLNGLALQDEKQYVDMHSVIDHKVPNCHSSQLYKTVLDESSEASYYGIINVHPDAQLTTAYQRNANLVLSETAQVHTRPQLIIDADDVKCSHGATVGQLDEEARFYMLSRGIPREEVSRLLMSAFVQDIIDGIGIHDLRSDVERLVGKRLRGERHACYDGVLPGK